MSNTEMDRLRAELREVTRNAHRADAERSEAQADLLAARAEVHRARAAASRAHADAVTDRAALDQVRRLCTLTIEASMRVQARQQAQDTLAVIEAVTAGQTSPGDEAWGTVWLHGNCQYLTGQMSAAEREHAADAVARWSAALAEIDGEERAEPDGLRWWRES